MGLRSFIADRLTNVMSGLGTTIDRRTSASYVFNPMTAEQAEAAFRTDWLARKVVSVPALDMTREWRDWQADDKQIEAIEAEEERLQLRAKCNRAILLSRLYGGAVIIVGDGASNAMMPLDPERISKDGLRYLRVMAPQQLNLGPQIFDPENEWVDRPEWFEIYAGPGIDAVKLHPSRVIEFIGQKAPEGGYYQSAAGSWFWGDPILQSIGSAIKNATMAQDGFATLIDEAKIDVLKMPDLTEIASTAEGERKIIARLSATMLGKSTWRALLLDAADEWEQKQVTWTGMPEMMDSFLNIVAGAADIPVTRLLGQSPKGLQSTGDGEERDYHSMVRAQQDEILAPALARIDELLIRSALGSRPPEIFYEFAALSELSEKDAATVDKTTAETLKIYGDTGLIHEEALAEIARNKMIETGRFPGCEAAFDAVDDALGSKSETPEQKEERIASEQTAAAELLKAGGGAQPQPFGSKKKPLTTSDYNPHHVETGEHGGEFTSGEGGLDRARRAAEDEVRQKGRNTGNEHLIIIDAATGEELGRSDGDGSSVGFDEEQIAAWAAEGKHVELIHNHPVNAGLSPADVTMLIEGSGVSAVTAVTPDGSSYTVRQSAQGKAGLDQLFGKVIQGQYSFPDYDSAYHKMETAATRSLRMPVHHQEISKASLDRIFYHLPWEQASRMGLLKYDAKLRGGTALAWKKHEALWNDALEAMAKATQPGAA